MAESDPGAAVSNRSIRILLTLLVAAIGISGWIYGWHWRNEGAKLRKQLKGTAFTREEQLIIDLQDQILELRKENDRLTAELSKFEPAD